MARKKRQEEHENHERWLVSYADFITLLFAFFVVMYSISSVNEGKYRVLSDAIVAAFRSPARSIEPVQIGKSTKSPSTEAMNLPFETRAKILQVQKQLQDEKKGAGKGAGEGAEDRQLKSIGAQIIEAMAPLIEDEKIEVREDAYWLEVEIKSNVLFPSGSSILTRSAEAVLADIAKILRDHPNAIHVEGYTDNVPIDNIIYPSNWELATARSSSVIRLFSGNGVAADRMVAIGFGENRPIAGNDTEAGRQKNRRVVIVISSTQQHGRHTDQIEERQAIPKAAGTAAAQSPALVPALPGEPAIKLPASVPDSEIYPEPNATPSGGTLEVEGQPAQPAEAELRIVPPGTIQPIILPFQAAPLPEGATQTPGGQQ